MKSKILAFIFITTLLTSPVLALAQTNTSSSCLKISRNLFIPDTGSDVTELQKFLKTNGYLSVEPTGYYGALTKTAVEKFQVAKNIVLNGTPETTGFGRVGPTTRGVIEKLTCGNSSSTSSNNDFFGYNLDDLFAPVSIDTNIDFNTNVDFNTNYNFGSYQVAEFDEIDLDDFDFEFDDIDFSNSLSGYDTAFKDDVIVLIFAKAVNGQYVRGGLTSPVAVASTTDVELAWDSNDAKDCVLTGDFKEKRLSVPVSGNAKLTMINPTGGRGSNGDPIYQFRISCNASTTQSYALPTSDTIKLWPYHE